MDSRLKLQIARDARESLDEDIGDGDLSAPLAAENCIARGILISQETTVLCGAEWFEQCFLQLDSGVVFHWRKRDGELLSADETVCEVQGVARALLSAERSAINFLQTLSATAAAARRWQQLAGEKVRVVDTRKTLPKLRVAQKYAVTIGGAHNHRRGLFDEILIKENHLAVGGGIAAVLAAAAKLAAPEKIQIEVRNLTELNAALKAGARRVLLDNFLLADLAAAVKQTNGAAQLEASGGVTENNIAAVAATGVDRISIGALTKNIRAAEFSFLLLTAK